MENELFIRNARTPDIRPLLRLYQQLDPNDPILDEKDAAAILAEISKHPGSAVLIGVVADLAVTTCTLAIFPNLTRGGAPYALIENVVTDSAFRKRGYGAAILKTAIALAWDSGCYKVMLMTGSKRPSTMRFYESAGFEQSKTGCQIRRTPPTAR